ncbi:MAG TPA: hypothetical protein VFV49_01175 [Thermoanaerobaculia bacterium]|nr:hypothetical protein [Thermoanaerobaculia bacterium]
MRALILFLSLALTPLVFADWNIVGMAPDVGTIGGGDLVIIRTTYKSPGDCNPFDCGRFPEVRFGGVVARSADNLDDLGVIRVITPSHAKGTVPVTVDIEGIPKTAGTYTFVDAEGHLPDWNYDQLLIPVAVGGTPAQGANGSLWVSELWVTNTGHHRVELMHGLPSCGSACAGLPFPGVETGETRKIDLPSNSANAAYRMYVQDAGKDALAFSLRIRDVSHAHEHQGTEIPLALASKFKESVTLLNVPMDHRARTSLRVYGWSAHLEDVIARVDVYPVAGREKIVTGEIPLHNPAFGTGAVSSYFSYGFVGDLRTLFPGLPEGSYRLEITAPDVERSFIHPLHALVSVTNNETQLVTAISAQ